MLLVGYCLLFNSVVDLLTSWYYNKSTTNPQQIRSCTTNPATSPQQTETVGILGFSSLCTSPNIIHNKLGFSTLCTSPKIIHNKSTTTPQQTETVDSLGFSSLCTSPKIIHNKSTTTPQQVHNKLKQWTVWVSARCVRVPI